MAEAPQQQGTQEKPVTQVVTNRVEELVSQGRMDLPAGYSAHNAIMNAWLILQQSETKDKRPVLEACTRSSIMQSLFDMVVQGLDPSRKQGYFIAYGDKLSFQKSYMGHKALAKRIDPRIYDIVAEVIWPEDEFRYEIDRGQKRIVQHVQSLDNIGNDKTPKGAYAQAIDHQGNVMTTLIMTWEQIKSAWSMSKMNPVNKDGSLKPDSTHAKFLEDMTKKTALSKLSRYIVGSSNDSDMLREAVEREGQEEDEARAEKEIAEANSEEITLSSDAFEEKEEPIAPAPEQDAPDDVGGTEQDHSGDSASAVDQGGEHPGAGDEIEGPAF